jgi:phasin family protein
VINQMQDFVNEQMQVLAGQAQQFGTDPLAAMRQGLAYSVDGLKSLEQPVRLAARSSVQLTEVTQKALEDLIHLQTEMVTSALNEVAAGFERAAHAKDAAALVGVQSDALRASAERLVNDANRALEIFTTASRGVQQVATQAYEQVAKTAATTARAAATPAPKAKRPAKRATRTAA